MQDDRSSPVRPVPDPPRFRARAARAVARMDLARWRRSGAPWLWAAFIGCWMVWSAVRGGDADTVWLRLLGLGAVLGFLAGYDAFSAKRERGYLRWLLLTPAPRWQIVVGSFAAGTVVVRCAPTAR